MNIVILMGRLTKDAEARYTAGKDGKQLCVARYTVAVDSNRKDSNGNRETDFINCIAFGKNGEFAEKYFKKGMRVAVSGSWQTGSYTNKDGNKVYTNECRIDRQEFAQSKSETRTEEQVPEFMPVPDGFDEDLPFK